MNENTLAAAEADLNSNKPKIFLPSDDRSVSEFAAQLGECLRKVEADIFIRGMRVVEARPPERDKAAQIAEQKAAKVAAAKASMLAAKSAKATVVAAKAAKAAGKPGKAPKKAMK